MNDQVSFILSNRNPPELLGSVVWPVQGGRTSRTRSISQGQDAFERRSTSIREPRLPRRYLPVKEK
jgi:hypothetical protein